MMVGTVVLSRPVLSPVCKYIHYSPKFIVMIEANVTHATYT